MISDSFIENNFPKGIVTLLGARPAMGKNSFGCSMAINLAKNKKFIYFLLGMDKKQMLEKIRRQTDEKEYAAIKEKIIIDDTPSIGIGFIRKRLENLPVDYLIIDYLQLLCSDNKEASREVELQSLIRGLKKLAKEFNVAIIVLSQLNRRCKALKDFDKSRFDNLSVDDLEDVHVAFLHRNEYYHLLEYDCNGNIITGRTMFISYKEEKPCVTCLHFNHETQEMSMWNRPCLREDVVLYLGENALETFASIMSSVGICEICMNQPEICENLRKSAKSAGIPIRNLK